MNLLGHHTQNLEKQGFGVELKVPNYVLSGSKTYTLHVLMKGAYIGKTNSVPCFLTCESTDANKYTYGP